MTISTGTPPAARTPAVPTPAARTVPALTGLQHIGLTVSDIDASESWYSSVFGLVRAFVEPYAGGGGYAVVMTRPGTGLFIGLEHHDDAERQRFSPRRTGLDHLAVEVPAREVIDEWIEHLDALGVEHEAVFEKEEPFRLAVVLVRDPDGIPVELFWSGG